MFRILCCLLAASISLLPACKPSKPTYHELMLNPDLMRAMVSECRRARTLYCSMVARAQGDTIRRVRELEKSPEAFGLNIMRAQRILASMEEREESPEKIQAQREHVKELQFATRLAGE